MKNDAVKEDDLYASGLHLWKRWTDMWNGDTKLALELVAPRLFLHLPLPSQTPAELVNDPATFERWVREFRATFDSLEFRYQAGPFVDVTAGVVAGPWIATAVQNGVPHVSSGMDTVVFRDGRVTEYWTLSKPSDAAGNWIRYAGAHDDRPHDR